VLYTVHFTAFCLGGPFFPVTVYNNAHYRIACVHSLMNKCSTVMDFKTISLSVNHWKQLNLMSKFFHFWIAPSFLVLSGCRTIQRQTIEEDFPIQRVKDFHSDFLFGGAKRTGAKGVIFSVMHTDISCTTTPSSVCVHVVSHLSTAVSCHND